MKTTIVAWLATASLMTASLMIPGPAAAAPAKEIRIGMVTTFTTAVGSVGKAARQGVDLALKRLGNKMDGIPVKMFYADDGGKPALAKSKTDELILQDHVDFIIGYNFSNMLLAAYNSAIDAKVFTFSLNAGPKNIAGKDCSPYFFAMGHQNDMEARGIGEVLNRRHIHSLYLVAPNYAAGVEMVNGVKSTFKGKVLGQSLTKWPDQLEFSAEISQIQATNPEAVFIFLTTRYAVQFMNQFNQAGLKGRIPIYSVATFDQFNLKVVGPMSIGAYATNYWVQDLDAPANKTFVAAYKKTYGGDVAGNAVAGYDAVNLIDSAVRAVKGDISDKAAVHAALKKADFASVRGRFSFSDNQFPIEDIYLQQVARSDKGEIVLKTIGKAVEQMHSDAPTACHMPPL
jgi:branched-chain amino acid transport system substrate-binding protein